MREREKIAGHCGGIRSIISIMLIFMTNYLVLGQETVSSGKTWIHINNEEKVRDANPVEDNVPPEIRIMSPRITPDVPYVSKDQEIKILGKISDELSGVSRYFINAEKFEPEEDGLFVQPIMLEKGRNNINILAVDNEDNITSIDLIIDYGKEETPVVKKKDTPNSVGKYYALLIGIDEYDDPGLPNLDYPISDAEELYKVLNKDYLFDKEHIILLKNATRSDINIALDNLAREITEEDNLLIFYAGHGWWDPDSDIGYWLPSDAHKIYKTDWFRNSTLCDYIREIDSRHTLLITDACFGGSIFKTRSISMDAPKAIQMLYELKSRKAMTSGTLTEVPDRSSFVRYLIKRLDDNKEKCLSSEQLFSSFRIAVINNSDVIPQYGEIKNVGDEGGDFIFIRRD